MKKYMYVLRDELSGEIANIFLANNDEVARIIIERAIEKQPLFGTVTLFEVGVLTIGDVLLANQPISGKARYIASFKPPKTNKRK